MASLNQHSPAHRLPWCAARVDSRVALLYEPGSASKISPHPAFVLQIPALCCSTPNVSAASRPPEMTTIRPKLISPEPIRKSTARLPDASSKALRFGSTHSVCKLRLTPDSDYTPAPASISGLRYDRARGTPPSSTHPLHSPPLLFSPSLPRYFFVRCPFLLPSSLVPLAPFLLYSRLGRADLNCDGSRTSALALAHPEFGFDSTSSPVHPSPFRRAQYLHTLLLLVSSPHTSVSYTCTSSPVSPEKAAIDPEGCRPYLSQCMPKVADSAAARHLSSFRLR
ncbi:hypothetical protein B0H14DRAFT_3872297 [Mycena olivaceomarginata]|nr:hypothetical protein B0H14DRAFT_3872297 [Mycena olivaceomarginata]